MGARALVGVPISLGVEFLPAPAIPDLRHRAICIRLRIHTTAKFYSIGAVSQFQSRKHHNKQITHNMQTIKDIKALPDGMIVEAVSGILDTVDEQKPYLGGDRPTTVQSFKFVDGKEFIYGSCWGHADITPFKGKQVIFASVKGGNNRFGGVTVKDRPDKKDPQKKWKNLNVSYSGVLHTPETWAAQAGKPAPEAPKPSTMPQDSRSPSDGAQIPPEPVSSNVGHPSANASVVLGQTCGMATKAAIDLLIAADPKVCESKEFATRLWKTASEIIRISQKLEAGFLAQKE